MSPGRPRTRSRELAARPVRPASSSPRNAADGGRAACPPPGHLRRRRVLPLPVIVTVGRTRSFLSIPGNDQVLKRPINSSDSSGRKWFLLCIQRAPGPPRTSPPGPSLLRPPGTVRRASCHIPYRRDGDFPLCKHTPTPPPFPGKINRGLTAVFPAMVPRPSDVSILPPPLVRFTLSTPLNCGAPSSHGLADVSQPMPSTEIIIPLVWKGSFS